MSNVWPSLNWTPGRIGHVFLAAYNPADGSTVLSRTVSNIVEDPQGGAYFLEGGLSAVVAFTVWDDDGFVIGSEMLQAPAVIGTAISVVNGVTAGGSIFVIKRHDSAPNLPYQARKADGTPVDISGSAVVFKMRAQPNQGILVVNRPASIVDGPNGLMLYSWQHSGADTATAGDYDGEFEVTFPDGSVETFPTTDPDTDAAHEYLTIKIPSDLD